MRLSIAVLGLAAALAIPAAAAAQAPTLNETLPPIAPADSALPATIERFLQVADMERMYNQSMELSMAAQLRTQPQMAQFEDIMRAFMARHVSWASMRPEFIRIYRETYTEADMQELIRFYQTDFGKRLMASMPVIMAKSNEVSSQRVQAALPELIAEVQARMSSQVGAPAPE